MIRRVYIAAAFPLKETAAAMRVDLIRAGFEVTSRWIDGIGGNGLEQAIADLDDIRTSDALVLINAGEWVNRGTGGRHTEVGYAIAYGMPVFVYGIPSNVFHELDNVRCCLTIDSLVHLLKQSVGIRPMNVIRSSAMIAELATRVHAANAKWWYNIETHERLNRNVGELLMLVTSELAEALEGHRKNLPDDKLKHRPMFDVEITDALIRLFDIIGGMKLESAIAFDEKMAFNAVREDHSVEHRKSEHGKKY
jgi:hypothetical protein